MRHRIGVVKNADVGVTPVLREGPLAVLEGVCFDACGKTPRSTSARDWVMMAAQTRAV
jgi:hypothetical protein